ncbi:recombinase family protein [Halocella sp. SP3-1]|uniref:recombinase family protein n=1 Tax=Halocella sp. SP3-1 TaxID=2382161 RepID=UPI000F7543B6|nr:recombinase family protein [Halocella sp. SP3-1]AZO95237.1 hypothetical protein D7D81_11920 [Halocella sp. SP3-1]
MKRAALYARVSTEKQAEKELSIPAQLQELKEYAAKNGMEVVSVYTDEGVSAKTDDRPEFQKMIAEAKQDPRPFDTILYHKNDRFARNREDAIVYKSLLRRDCGIELIAIKEDFGDGPVAQMIEGILEVIAEFYSLNLAQEVKKGMREKAKQGKVLGETPLGYTIGPDGHLEIVEDEAEVVKYIFQEYTSTNKGLRSIAQDLKTKGKMLFGEAGTKYKWSGTGIGVIIKNRAYTGTMIWNQREAAKNNKKRSQDKWITVPNAHKPIIDKKTFIKAQEILNSKRNYRSDSKGYLLRGLVKCMDCGSNMSQYSDRWKRKDGTKGIKRKFRCSNYVHTGECYFNTVGMKELEKSLFSYFKRLRNRLRKGTFNLNNINISYIDSKPAKERLAAKEKELENMDRRFERQMMAFENGVIDLEHLRQFKDRLQEEKKQLQNEIKKLEKEITAERINTSLLAQKIDRVITTLEDEEKPLGKKQEILKEVLDYVEYSRDKEEMAVHIKY